MVIYKAKPEGLTRLQAGVKPLLKTVGTVALKGRQILLPPRRGWCCVRLWLQGLRFAPPLPVLLSPLRGRLPPMVTAIAYCAYNVCPITSLHISAGVTSIADMAVRYCGSLHDITVDEANPVYDSRGGYTVTLKENTLSVRESNNSVSTLALPRHNINGGVVK